MHPGPRPKTVRMNARWLKRPESSVIQHFLLLKPCVRRGHARLARNLRHPANHDVSPFTWCERRDRTATAHKEAGLATTRTAAPPEFCSMSYRTLMRLQTKINKRREVGGRDRKTRHRQGRERGETTEPGRRFLPSALPANSSSCNPSFSRGHASGLAWHTSTTSAKAEVFGL